jgi:putative hydrolase of HD superfamily
MLQRAIQFLFEAGMLKKTPRTGYQFLGSGGESVADHSFRTAVIGYVLGSLETALDRGRVVLMCLFHDLPEARTGDHNYVNKRYVRADEENALSDQVKDLFCGEEIASLLREYNEGNSREAILSHDADQLDLIMELKEQLDSGNTNAREWLAFAVQRLQTETAQKMAHEILTTHSSDWWFDKKTDWWVNGPGNHRESK